MLAASQLHVIFLMKIINDFAKIADQFCSWTESLQKSDEVDLGDLLIMLSSLLNKALLMPSPESYDLDEATESLTQKEWKAIHKKYTPIKFQYYREVFDPHNFDDDEPVTGDLHDDLADIYRDIKPGLVLFREGLINEAAFEWKFSFNSHWGEHILSALRAIYMFKR